MGGIGVAYYMDYPPMNGAFAAAFLFVIVLTYGKIRFRQKLDTLIAALWSGGMALGILFMYLKPGYKVDLLSYLFGNILMVTSDSIMGLIALDAVLLLLVILFFKPLMYVSFDEEYTRMRGVRTGAAFFILMCIVAVTVVMLTRVVGIIMVIAMMTMPAASAAFFSRSMGMMMALSVVFASLYSVGGLLISYYADLPAGAVIILCAVAGYLISFMMSRMFLRKSLS